MSAHSSSARDGAKHGGAGSAGSGRREKARCSWRRDNGLSIALLGCFLITLGLGQVLTGRREYNQERVEWGLAPLGWVDYVASAHFLEATAENWESEFFQMFVYVTLTVFLFQRGSAESKDPDNPNTAEPPLTPRSPWAARRGGWVRRIYEHSLSLALAGLFAISFWMHAIGGAQLRNEEELAAGRSPISTLEYLGTSRFWFESFQNWQSEFLAIGAMVVLSVFLREKNSPESKPVNLPHAEHE